MKKNLVVPAIALLFLVGCATGSHILTGTARPAISPDAVKIYAAIPDRAETIGIVQSANAGMYKQQGIDSCLNKMKSIAAGLGANGIVIKTETENAWTGSEVSGTAIYTP